MKRKSLLKVKSREQSFVDKSRNKEDFFVKANFIRPTDQKERYCSVCGEMLSEDLKFCFYCGSTTPPRTKAPKEQEPCPYCGALLNPELPACPKCDRHILGDISQPY